MSNVRAQQMPPAATGAFVSVATVRAHRLPGVFVAAQHSASVTSRVSSTKAVGSWCELSRSFVDRCLRCRVGVELVAFMVRFTRSLRANVLRRAISSLSRLRGSAALGFTIAPCQSEGAVVNLVASYRFVVYAKQRPNPLHEPIG